MSDARGHLVRACRRHVGPICLAWYVLAGHCRKGDAACWSIAFVLGDVLQKTPTTNLTIWLCSLQVTAATGSGSAMIVGEGGMTVVAATAIGTGIGEAQAGLSKVAPCGHAHGEQRSHQQSSATMHGMHGIQE